MGGTSLEQIEALLSVLCSLAVLIPNLCAVLVLDSYWSFELAFK
jgi:hypothetical protein